MAQHEADVRAFRADGYVKLPPDLLALDDLFNVGTPSGVQAASRVASVALSVRAFVVVPVLLWWVVVGTVVCLLVKSEV